MTRPRLDYIERRRLLAEQRAAHRKGRPVGCRCELCIGVDGIAKLLDERVREQFGRTGEAPF